MRPYTDGPFTMGRQPVPPGLRSVLIVTASAFIIQHLVDFRTGMGLTEMFGLSRWGILRQWRLWQLVTYLFLHDGFIHILFNMVVLYSFGRELEAAIGTRRFLALYLISGVLGGIGWLLLTAGDHTVCIGASGAVFGVAAAFAAREPKRKLSLVIFPIPVPVTMTARTMVIAFGAASIVFLLIGTGNIAHAAHLAGGVAGYVYGRRLRGDVSHSGWTVLPPDPNAPDVPDPEEVDRILEKVHREGLSSLTWRERAILETASRGRDH